MASRKDAIDTEHMLNSLQRAGIARDDAEALRRISMTLHRWHELECGGENGCIERENDDGTGRAYWLSSMTSRRSQIADRETGARKRLARIMAKYPSLSAYVQSDPRGCALYILPPGTVPDGADAGSYYSRGLAVFK